MRNLILRVLAACALVATGPAALAQGSLKSVFDAIVKPAVEATPVPQPPIEEQIAWARTEAAAADALLGEASEKEISARIATAGLPATRIEDFRTAARDVQRAATSAAELLGGIGALETEVATAPVVPVPSSEEEAATVRETLRRATLSEKSAAGEAELLGRMVTQFQTLSANAEREIRQAQEEQAAATTDEAKARTALQLELAGWQKRASDVNGFFVRWRLYQQELFARKARLTMDATAAALGTGGFDRQLNAARAAGQIKAVNVELPVVEKKLASAKTLRQQALDERREAPENAAARIAPLDALVEASQGLVYSLEGTVSLLELERGHWQTVERLAQSKDEPEVRSAIAQANEAIRSLKDWRPLLDRRLSEAREALEGARKRSKETRDDASTRRLWERAAEAAGQRVDALGAVLIKTEQILLLEKDFLDEMDAILREENLLQRAGRTWLQAGAVVAGIWTFELWHSGGSRITVGKVVVALAGILMALALSGLIARWGARTSRRSFSLGESQSLIVEKIVFFPAAALMVFTILNWLSIPLGAFTFLGGALAIGVGFGAQNLMNNFISGLILLTERQIKVGDIIEVGPSTGRITHLGTRCSRLRKFDGVEVLIPNSAFLEKEVTNWTLNDPLHRYDFSVGVAYGTPAEKVIELLRKALIEQPEVMKDPEPGVFFENFGDSSLVFRLYYWLEVGGLTDSRQVGSDIRRRIDRDFREAGIEMPFPQRDLHLRSPEVLQVRLEK